MLYLAKCCSHLVPRLSNLFLRNSRPSYYISKSVNSFEAFLPRYYFQRRTFSKLTVNGVLRASITQKLLSGARFYKFGSPYLLNKVSSRFLSTKVDKYLDLRGITTDNEKVKRANRNYALYFTAGFFLFIGVAYASAPLYKAFCQATNLGGELSVHLRDEKAEKLATIDPVKEYGEITVKFHSAKDSRLNWDFRPQQESVKVYPGETALAFFTATNPTDRPIVGVSTYNIIPYEAAPYFNKIQCFCFDDQRLEPNESVDMPVFFYIDPDIISDYRCKNVKEIVLGYTFFESKGGLEVPPANSPGVAKMFEKQY